MYDTIKMVLITEKVSAPQSGQIPKTRKILMKYSVAITCLLVPGLIIIIDPIHTIVNYNLRLKIGSALYNLLINEMKGARLSIYPFNISNADKFMSGEDSKMKLEEVGPFVYQEYRWYENIKMNEDGSEMEMTSKFRPEFVPKESIAYPKDINLTVANIPMLSATALLSPYPSFMRFMFSTMAAQMNSKAIMNIDLHSYMWGVKNPLITLCNKLIPGIVYYESFGLLDRLYDKESDYRIVVGTTKQDRFKIKSVTKYLHLDKGGIENFEVSQLAFIDTYEGIGYPFELSPDVPINWYRVPICRTFELEYRGSKTMEYGGEGLVYTISNTTFINETNPITRKTYPNGLMDISKCYYGMPFVASNSHFVDGDPKLLEYVEGLMPDRTRFSNDIIIDRRAAVPYYTKLSLQLNLVIDDISYNKETSRFSNTILPILRLEVNQPKMSDLIITAFYVVYTIGPWFLIILESALIIVSLRLITSATQSVYWKYRLRWLTLKKTNEKKVLTEKHSNVPLISDNIKAGMI